MILLYSSRPEVINHWIVALAKEEVCICENEQQMYSAIDTIDGEIILCVEHRHHDNIEAFLELFQTTYSHIKIMLFSAKPSYEEGHALLKFGIKTYANTYMDHIHIQDAVKAVKHGDVWLYPEFIQMMIHELSLPEPTLHVKQEILRHPLSEREMQIALLLKKGLSNKEIAERTGISERTVKAHLSSVYEKTGTKDRLSLALALS